MRGFYLFIVIAKWVLPAVAIWLFIAQRLMLPDTLNFGYAYARYDTAVSL